MTTLIGKDIRQDAIIGRQSYLYFTGRVRIGSDGNFLSGIACCHKIWLPASTFHFCSSSVEFETFLPNCRRRFIHPAAREGDQAACAHTTAVENSSNTSSV